MQNFFGRFMNFDKLIATSLIKVLYWIGVVGIALGTLLGLLGALAAFGQSFAAGLGSLIIVPIGGLVGLIFWRFMCEVYLVIFGIYDRLGNIQKAVGGGEPKDVHSVAD